MLYKELMAVGGGQTIKPLVNDITINIEFAQTDLSDLYGYYNDKYTNIGSIVSENKIQMSPHDNGWTYSTAKILSFFKDTFLNDAAIELQVTNLENFSQPYPFKMFIKQSSQTKYTELSTDFYDASTYNILQFYDTYGASKIASLIPSKDNTTVTYNIILWCENWQN